MNTIATMRPAEFGESGPVNRRVTICGSSTNMLKLNDAIESHFDIKNSWRILWENFNDMLEDFLTNIKLISIQYKDSDTKKYQNHSYHLWAKLVQRLTQRMNFSLPLFKKKLRGISNY
ncbi:hypothetical protein BpHYR1_005806 [Brachionus plicatilis]|uniref:Uncharacterized protein n=1 Tax=Brachionus plicatilis TaxID=10195 RepID=A0A3M7QE29_BRAPC|nr:hypothetical protein BpHYR1_005806 [Brachionus plicatilis]